MSWKLQVYSLIGIALIGFICNYLIDDNIELRKESQSLNKSLSAQIAINAHQRERIQHLSELEAKHLQDLTHANAKIDRLSDDLRAGTQRVYVKADCPATGTTAAAGVDDARPARLAKDAEPDYLRLLRELETLERQFLGLRDWAAAECQR
ncbi:lysis system i-spanin subunit Rz [Xenorhabdus szentirmaii]|uniref:Endopeptidase n=1 Tax=Xenorhabdus szentirmaii DSM 16338 TaxID=1427518 RepID=W1IZC2_9GAMM|nr:lysis system i-spanin subunit Rz [Xenorhabdus szentirmaii]PHM32037.1 lysis protein [Xenorhabdus szentirmaii DSM 16338]CDL83837.1 putative Endopeptidase [Xenorhabdus szentirmaii DSM 16338]